MPLLIVVGALIVLGIVWRARVARRLTMEESVDRYRRTLSAVHEAATRSRAAESPTTTPAATFTARRRRSFRPPGRGAVVAAGAVVVIVVVVSIVIATHDDGSPRARVSTTSTTRPPATDPTTTTTVAAPTTTRPLVSPGDTTGAAFVIGKPSYTLVLKAASSACWVEARDQAGKSLFTGLLEAGASQSITATTATVNLGNPSTITVTADGAPVPFVTHNGAPITLHFQGTA